MTAKPSYEELERRVQELETIESEYNHLMAVSQENESLFKRLYEKAPLGYQSLDENGHFLVVNPTWLDTLGYAKEEVIGKSFADFLHPDWRDHFKENFPRFKSIGEVLGVEFEMVKKNGNPILVSFTGKISRDKKGDFQQTHCIFHDITERRRVEEDLQKEKTVLKAIIDSIPVMITRYDPHFNLLYLNKAFERKVGWKNEELKDINLMEEVYPDPAYREIAHEYMEKAVIEWQEFSVRAKSGENVISEWSNICLDEGTRIGIGIDITDRKLAEEALQEKNEEYEALNEELQSSVEELQSATEELQVQNEELQQQEVALRESEERYRGLVTNLNAGVVVHAADTTIIMNNPRASTILGLSDEQMRGKLAIDPEWKFIMENLTPYPIEDYPVNQIVRTRQGIENINIGIKRPATNDIVWVLVNGFPSLDSKGEISEIVISFVDITERKQAEEKLRESEAVHSKMIANIGDVIVIIDRNGINRYKSPNIEKWFGWQPADVVGFNTWDNVHPDDLEKGQTFIGTLAFTPNASGTTEIRYRCKDGNYKWIEITIVNLMHDTSINGFLGNYHDITERKQSESALKLVAESSLLSARDIFPFLVRQIAVSQGMRYALIARVDPSDSTAHTVAIWCGDRYGENFSYALEGTPCNNVVSAGACFYPSNVQSLFPHDQLLVDMGIESYWGTALRNSTGELLGVMAIMHDQPIIETPQTHALLQAFALRTSVEMERQQTEELLRKNQADLKEAQHVAKLGNWRLNIKNNQVVWSDELYKMYGFDPTLPPPPYTEHMKLFTPESWESLSAALQQTKDTGIPYDLELKTLRIDGSHGWMWAHGMAEVDATKEIIGLRGVAQDITERKQAEEDLRESEKRFKKMFHNHSAVMLLIAPGSGVIIDANLAAEKFYGYSHEELLSINISHINTLAPELIAAERHAALDENRNHFIFPHRLSDGEIRTVEVYSTPITVDTSTLLFSIIHDITERKQAEEQFVESEKLLSQAQKIAHTGSWKLDLTSNHLIWSDEVYRIFGYKPREFAATYEAFLDAVHPDERIMVNEAYSRSVLEGSDGYEFEHRIVQRNSGEVRHVYERCVHERDGAGTVIRSTGMVQDITERKQAEEALRENEQNLRTLSNSGLALIWTSDTNKFCKYFNRVWLEFTGRTLEQEIGNGWVEGVHPDDLQRCLETSFTAYERQEGFSKEYRLRRHDGIYRWIIDEGLPRYDSHGNFIGYIGHCLDITERKLAEEALRESDERHRKYLMNAPYGIFVTDEKGRYQQVNPAACSMSGYEEQELLAMSIPDLLFKENIEKGLQHFQRVLRQGQSQGELLFQRKNNERRWWSVNAVKISETQFLGFCIDVTEPKQADELIQKRILSLTQPMEYSEIKLEDLFNLDELQTVQDQFALATGVASLITRIDGTPVTTPSNFTRLCSEIIRKTEQGCANCIKSDAALGCYNPGGPIVQPCLSGGLWDAGVNIVVGGHHIANWMIGQVRSEAQNEDELRSYAALIGADVETFMQAFREVPSMSVERFENIAQALFTLVNQLCTTAYQNVLQARFIAERKQAEKEKDKLQAQLIQAQKMEAVGQLAGGVAHDFNNMLGVIIGYSELILEQMDPSQQFHADLVEIEKAARRSADLTRQLLTFARKQTVAPRVLDLNQTIEGMLTMLRRLIGENISLSWMPGFGLWPINMDPSQIDQILANLCVNGRDAIAGVGKLTVETKNASFDKEYCATHAGSLPGDYVQIAVSDTGSGMDKETLAHIFEPFFTTKDVGEGTGLGLATVYGAVKQNNGFINAYSEPGQGSIFTIYIPRHVETTAETRITASPEPVVRGNEIVMLVEDEPTLLQMSKTMLERMGYTVLAAGTPGEAIRLAGEYSGRIHLLATDVIMPEMNGRELSVRLLESRPEMKCLFMSGYTANIIANQGVLKKGVPFIQKPFSKNELAAKVREAMEG